MQCCQRGAPQGEGAPKLGSLGLGPVHPHAAGCPGASSSPYASWKQRAGQRAPRLCCTHVLVIPRLGVHPGICPCLQRGLHGEDPAGLEVGFGAHSISAYVEATGLPNLLPPILLDVSQGWETWGGTQPATLDLLVSINMMHITELRCTEVSGPPQPRRGLLGGVPGPLTLFPPLLSPRACSRVPGCC